MRGFHGLDLNLMIHWGLPCTRYHTLGAPIEGFLPSGYRRLFVSYGNLPGLIVHPLFSSHTPLSYFNHGAGIGDVHSVHPQIYRPRVFLEPKIVVAEEFDNESLDLVDGEESSGTGMRSMTKSQAILEACQHPDEQ